IVVPSREANGGDVFVIKAVTYGYGRQTSPVVAYAYNYSDATLSSLSYRIEPVDPGADPGEWISIPGFKRLLYNYEVTLPGKAVKPGDTIRLKAEAAYPEHAAVESDVYTTVGANLSIAELVLGVATLDGAEQKSYSVKFSVSEMEYVIDYEKGHLYLAEGLRYSVRADQFAKPTQKKDFITPKSRVPVDLSNPTLVNGVDVQGMFRVDLNAALNKSTAGKTQTLWINSGKNIDSNTSTAKPAKERDASIGAIGGLKLLRRATAAEMKRAGAYHYDHGAQKGFVFSDVVYGKGRIEIAANKNFTGAVLYNRELGKFYNTTAFGANNSKVYVRILGSLGEGLFTSATAELTVPKLAELNKWDGKLKATDFIDYRGAYLPGDAKKSSVVKWKLPADSDVFNYYYSIGSGSSSANMAEAAPNKIEAGASIESIPGFARAFGIGGSPADVAFRVWREYKYLENGSGAPQLSAANSKNFTLAKAPNMPANPKIDAVRMTLAAKNTMEYRIVDSIGEPAVDGGGTTYGVWKPVSGSAVYIPYGLVGEAHYVQLRLAATASKPPSLIRQSAPLPKQVGLFKQGVEPADVSDIFKYNTVSGVLSVNPNLPSSILSLGYTKTSKLDVSMNGSYWIMSASAKDLRPYLTLTGADREFGEVFVRFGGNKNVGASEPILLTINIKTGKITARG
ncbi:MAG: hypothetical protein FWE66_05350, partial [Oscillospiraceae bacterium]|nr:hypothetical protein [Oscillospiraceae bacterium]